MEVKVTRYGDIGTTELLARKGLEVAIIEGQPRARVKNISPIHTMYARGQLDLAQYSAGEKLYQCWKIGFEGIGSCEIQERTDGGGKNLELTESQVNAIHQYCKGLAGAGIEAPLVKSVCCYEHSLTNRAMLKNERVQLKNRLANALDGVARVYGFK